jgi:hypothetical protein
MRKDNCELIRRELDELMLDEAYSSTAVEHLRECADCREFQDKQTKLRQIVGGLGTVSAPPDFDFRLRARLANEASAASQFHFSPLARRGLALATLLLVFATGAVLVRNIVNRPSGSGGEVASKENPKVNPPDQPVKTVTPDVPKSGADILVAGVPEKRPQIKNERLPQPGFRSKAPLGVKESSSTAAVSINGMEFGRGPATFPIDVSDQAFKVSLADGRGNARTISVPPISFGSQRIVQTANQLAPKRAW